MRGSCLYAYERWQRKGQPERAVYLGRADSEAVQEIFTVKYQEKRKGRLEHDLKEVRRLLQNYQPYDFESVVSGMGQCSL